jgi:unsaturated chondroitin disaccharide hydrolase
MKLKHIILFISIFIAKEIIGQQRVKIDVDKQFKIAATHYENMLASHQDIKLFPQSTKPDGSEDNRKSEWWCSGFFGGSLWHLYEYFGEDKWKAAATKWTHAVEKEKYNTTTHDLGFMIYCPFGNGYRLTGDTSFLESILTGAQSLSTRFNPDYGTIKSWDRHENCDYTVIIDNMMNLELLFWAAKKSGDRKLYDISIIHADNTIKNHFRKDYSSYHVLCYEPGVKVFRKKTHQGAADESAWARGQAWALYGYTIMYRETQDVKYLKQAEGIAKFIMNHPNLPKDKIPFWDYNAPKIPNEERDASAAAITASALLELSTLSTHKKTYFSFAEAILKSLSSEKYTAKVRTNNNFILMHSVGHKPGKSEINTPIIYADYYYLESLLRYKKLKK